MVALLIFALADWTSDDVDIQPGVYAIVFMVYTALWAYWQYRE